MCGISGFVDFKGGTSPDDLHKMNRMMAHRGPDGEGYSFYTTGKDVQVGLGHRRLSIIDLTEGGSQPKHFDHLHITFNGEIYNFEEIKIELSTLGHSFESHSDTEVILHAYREWGVDAVQKFIGMFAFVIYDEEKTEIICCRDRAGVKPFFYYWNDGLFLFASELKAIMTHPRVEKNINTNALAAYLQYGYVPTPHCIFEKTHKLQPGHYLTLSVESRELSVNQYWSVYNSYNKPSLDISFPEAVTETEKLLSSAFQYRMVSDVPVGVFLSGGYDSSCVTAILQAGTSNPLKTFTIGIPDAGLDEAPHARRVADHLGTDHTEFYCTEKEAVEIIPELPFYYDEPFADSSAIPTTLVSRLAKEKVTVALSADGGDEIFAGYNRYDYMSKYGTNLKRIPGLARKAIAGIMDAVPADKIPVLNKKYLFNSRYEKLKSVLKDPSASTILHSLTRQWNKKELDLILKMPTTLLDTAFDKNLLEKPYFSDLSFMMAVDYETYLVDDILQKVDRATMSVSLEGREPFLDQRIIEWAAILPMKYKYHDGNKKIILKEIVHKYLPKEMMDRPKMGFGIPIGKWLKTELSGYIDIYFSPVFLAKQGLFHSEEISELLQSFKNGRTEKTEKIWFLLMFQMWYDKWMNNN